MGSKPQCFQLIHRKAVTKVIRVSRNEIRENENATRTGANLGALSLEFGPIRFGDVFFRHAFFSYAEVRVPQIAPGAPASQRKEVTKVT